MEQRSGDSGSYKRYFRIAAAITGAIIAGAALFQIFQNQQNTVRFAEVAATTTTITDTLTDGSVVTLNKNSTVLFPVAFAEGERRVTLRGEAFFDVVKDAGKPFIIEAGDVEVKVIGTSFNVKAYEDSEIIEVVVETGIVRVESIGKKESITLEAGSRVVYNKITGAFSKTVSEDAGYSFWRTHKLNFRNTPLKDVVDALNNYYAAGITYENENIGRCRFTATFENDSLSTILEILSMTFQLEVKQGDSGKVLSGTGCEDAQL
jgi:ferric-dicitrate binding protein FerR (iron transport regulator)